MDSTTRRRARCGLPRALAPGRASSARPPAPRPRPPRSRRPRRPGRAARRARPPARHADPVRHRSIVVGWDARGRWARAGGLGPFVGDEGSGFWLGREWLRATARDGLQATLRVVHTPDPVRAIAALAPTVLARARRGDRRARRIVAESQRLLADGAHEVVRALKLRQPVNASWAGSVLENRWFRTGLIRAVARAGLKAHWHRPAERPVIAAARLAAEMASA